MSKRSLSDDHDSKPFKNHIKKPLLEHDEMRRTRSKRKKERDAEKVIFVERVKEDFGHTVFPYEIWDKIFVLLPKSDLRSLTLVCKNLRLIANRFFWEIPTMYLL